MFDSEESYWWYRALHSLIIDTINKKGRNLKILDAGCGTCRLLQLLEKNNSVEGFDFSLKALDFCRKRGIDNVYLQNINEWRSEKKFDVIVSADVICSSGIENEQKIINNFYSALKNEGLLILNLPAFDILSRNHDKAVYIRKRYKKKEIENLIKNAGFSYCFVTYRLPWLYFIILIKKISQKIFFNKKSKSDLSKLPKFLNQILLKINMIENILIKKRIKIPFGSSVFAIAKK